MIQFTGSSTRLLAPQFSGFLARWLAERRSWVEIGREQSGKKRQALKPRHGKAKIVIVGAPVFSRAIKHLFHNHPDFEVASTWDGVKNLGPWLKRLDPLLIVANFKPVGTNIRCAVHSLKRFSPKSKLILICPFRDLAKAARDCGADACLEPDELVRRLLPAAAVLSIPRRSARSKYSDS